MRQAQEHLLQPETAKKFLDTFFSLMKTDAVGADMNRGITLVDSDIPRVKEGLRMVFDFDNSAIELNRGDILQFDAKAGHIYILTPEKQHRQTITPTGIIPVTAPVSPNTTESIDATESQDLSVAQSLATHLKKHAPVHTGANSCGRSVHMTLQKWGIHNPPRGNGNQWYTLLDHDPRFQPLTVSSLESIPPGAILCFG